MFKFLAKARVFSYENDFGDHEGVDQASDLVEIPVVKLIAQQHPMAATAQKKNVG